MEDRTNRNERNPLPFWLPAKGWFFLFFSSTIVYRIGPGPVRRIVLPKLLVIDLTSFHWLRRVTFFVCGAWRNVKDSLSPHTDARGRSVPGLLVVRYQPKMLTTPSPNGAAYFLYFMLSSNAVSEHPSVFSSVAQNHQAYTMESFFLYSPSLPAIPLTHVSPHFALFSVKIVPLDKRGSNAFRQGKRCDHLQSINFTSGVTTSPIFFCTLCPRSFQPLQIQPRPSTGVWCHCKTIKTKLLLFPLKYLCFCCRGSGYIL